MEIKWDSSAKEKFDKVIQSLPQFHRTIAEKLVHQKAEDLASCRKSPLVEDQDLIQAFFQEVPPAFCEMMKRLFDHLNIDYSKYIEEQDK
ncbi:MAG: hypothetical protein K9L84_03045 [Candidatus Omnitrophica bacterium]|nr:hypothetical protein [Candidatus Omnitrophota bacterium]MCF7894017.1 hypothetical protein [Candidatus Omnitrophota bacterium]